MQHADLRRGQADAERVVHQLAHALDLRRERVVEALDRQRLGAQHRVAELAHVAQRGVAPRARLGVELLGLGRVVLALDLDVVGLRAVLRGLPSVACQRLLVGLHRLR